MELRRISLCVALFVLAVVSHSSVTEARHAVQKREADDSSYDDNFLGDAADEQNDVDVEPDDETVTNATIVSRPENYNITIGKTIRLDCVTNPKTGVVIHWDKNGNKIFMGRMKMIVDKSTERLAVADGSNDLLIRDSQPEDSGRYTCIIVQAKPEKVEHRVVITEPPRITNLTATNNGHVKVGQPLLLTCKATGHPKPSIFWSKFSPMGGNHRLGEGDGEFTETTFFIKEVQPKDAGTYLCNADNNSENVSSSFIQITVRSPPLVHVHRTIINTDLGVEAILQCVAHETQADTTIRWLKNRVYIGELPHITINTVGKTSNLTVTPSTAEDFGEYTCEAENQYGKHDRAVELVREPVIEEVDAQGPKLSWTIHSHQPLKQIMVELRNINESDWRQVLIPLPGTKDHKYENSFDLSTSDNLKYGKYEAIIRVQNEAGWSKRTSPVPVEWKAEPIATASILFRNSAYAVQPTTALLSTILMYLLVRM